MSFQHKDDGRNAPIPGPSAVELRDSDDETRSRGVTKDPKTKVILPKRIPSPLKQYGRTVVTRSPPKTAPPPVKSGPVVLDKFGNFR